jgi:hypothetical protein
MLQQVLTRSFPSIKTALRPLMMTSVELVSRDRDYAESVDLGRDYYPEKTVTILSREPLSRQAIHNVVKQNKGFRFETVRCEPYTPVIDVIGYTGTHF